MSCIDNYVYKHYCKKCKFKIDILKNEAIDESNIMDILTRYQQIVKIKDINEKKCCVTVNLSREFDVLNSLKFFVLEYNGSRFVQVACLHSKIEYDEYNKVNNIEIESLFVCEKYRSKGYGSLIMENFIEYAHKFNPLYIHAYIAPCDEYVEENKLRRNHLYEKYGFIIDEENRKVILDISGHLKYTE